MITVSVHDLNIMTVLPYDACLVPKAAVPVQRMQPELWNVSLAWMDTGLFRYMLAVSIAVLRVLHILLNEIDS